MKPGPRACVREERERLEKLPFERIVVKPLAPTIGAEIEGVDLGRLDDETFAEIHAAWLAYKVVFFRNQQIDAEQQMSETALSRAIAPLSFAIPTPKEPHRCQTSPR
jgi:taurine dioxygenase